MPQRPTTTTNSVTSQTEELDPPTPARASQSIRRKWNRLKELDAETIKDKGKRAASPTPPPTTHSPLPEYQEYEDLSEYERDPPTRQRRHQYDTDRSSRRTRPPHRTQDQGFTTLARTGQPRPENLRRQMAPERTTPTREDPFFPSHLPPHPHPLP